MIKNLFIEWMIRRLARRLVLCGEPVDKALLIATELYRSALPAFNKNPVISSKNARVGHSGIGTLTPTDAQSDISETIRPSS